MDLLAATGFINYFGKVSDVTKLTISPLVIRKGKSVMALYGMGYMNDQRLSRLWRSDKVHFVVTIFVSFLLDSNNGLQY